MKINKQVISVILLGVFLGTVASVILIKSIKSAPKKPASAPAEVTPVEKPEFIPRAEAVEPLKIAGEASFYNRTICPLHNTTYGIDCRMKNGEIFDDTAMVAACPRELLGEKIKVSHNQYTIIVTCTDTGSFSEKYNRVLDLSEGAFTQLSPAAIGTIDVEYEILHLPV